jgi:uncharacterized protein YneF (UPF0154 family)
MSILNIVCLVIAIVSLTVGFMLGALYMSTRFIKDRDEDED